MRELERLVAEFEKFPGVGRRTAERFAYHLLGLPSGEAEALAESILALRRTVAVCSSCGGYGESDPCTICSDPSRQQDILCIVEHPGAIALLERTRRYRGLYHVLGAPLRRLPQAAPAGRRAPSIKALLARVEKAPPREVLLALPPSAEGEATAARLARLLKPLGLRVTRIGIGLPVGGELEYADEATLSRALDGRQEI